MFELLMLTSFALIIFSQELPPESPKKVKTNLKIDDKKKQPCRDGSDRAASSNYARKKLLQNFQQFNLKDQR